jgi:nucleolar protein 14
VKLSKKSKYHLSDGEEDDEFDALGRDDFEDDIPGEDEYDGT